MLSRPSGVSDEAVRHCVEEHWDVALTDLHYLPVGFGSHHWDGRGGAGARWFVTVDEVGTDDVALRGALETAADLHAAGCDFVVAPIRTSDGAVLARLGDFAVALYPHVDGETYDFGEYASEEHRWAVLDILVALHAIPPNTARHASRDQFVIPHRPALERALDHSGADTSDGPYAAATAELLQRNRAAIRRALETYDGNVARIDEPSRPVVVTHGEPHAANTIRTGERWLLVDWDTTQVAPCERDLWSLAAGTDASNDAFLDAYARATGHTPSAAALSLYSMRWDLVEIALYADRFRHSHSGDADDDQSWIELVATMDHLLR